MKHTTKIMLQNYDISYYARRKQEIGSLYSCLRCTCFIISAALGGCGTLGLLMYYASDACDTYMLSCENYIPTRKQVLSIPANYNAPTNSWYALLQLDTCLIPVPDQPRFRNQYDAIDYVEKYPVDSFVSIGIPKSEPFGLLHKPTDTVSNYNLRQNHILINAFFLVNVK